MKKLLKTILILVIIIGVLFIWYDQSRSFFKATNGEYITMWKRYGGTCYLISGKYYGITKPNDGYIETNNFANLTIYYSNKLPNYILIRKESNDNYIVSNPINKEYLFDDYTSNREKYKRILYNEGEVRFSDIKKGASLLSINILEGYAKDEKGNIQK